MFTKILVPLDGSELSESILPYVSHLAIGMHSRLLLLSVVDAGAINLPAKPPEGAPVQSLNQISSRMEKTLAEHLSKVSAQLAQEGLQVTALVTRGKAADEIVRVAEEEGCDLVAMATHGRKLLGREILGNVTDKVLHSSRLPTLTIRPTQVSEKRPGPVTLTRLIVPLDGSELAEAALPYVISLATEMKLHVILVNIVRIGTYMYADGSVMVAYDVETILEEEAKDYLKRVADSLKARGISVESKVLRGHPGDLIGEMACNTPAELVVLATHGRSGLSRWIIGSVAESVVRSCGDPVLIIPPLSGVKVESNTI